MINSFMFAAAALTSFTSSLGSTNQATTCGLALNQTYYHNGSGALPDVADTVYTDLAGTTPLTTRHYKRGTIGTFRIEAPGFGDPQTGVVQSVDICI